MTPLAAIDQGPASPIICQPLFASQDHMAKPAPSTLEIPANMTTMTFSHHEECFLRQQCDASPRHSRKNLQLDHKSEGKQTYI